MRGMGLERAPHPDLLGKEGGFDSSYTKSPGDHALSQGTTTLIHSGGRWVGQDLRHWVSNSSSAIGPQYPRGPLRRSRKIKP